MDLILKWHFTGITVVHGYWWRWACFSNCGGHTFSVVPIELPNYLRMNWTISVLQFVKSTAWLIPDNYHGIDRLVGLFGLIFFLILSLGGSLRRFDNTWEIPYVIIRVMILLSKYKNDWMPSPQKMLIDLRSTIAQTTVEAASEWSKHSIWCLYQRRDKQTNWCANVRFISGTVSDFW